MRHQPTHATARRLRLGGWTGCVLGSAAALALSLQAPASLAFEAATPPPAPDAAALAAAAAAGPASTAAYGARCVGPTFDDTAAFQAAIDTGRTVYAPAMGGHCHVTRPLVMRTPGQIFYGDGRARTTIEVRPGFAGAGVFVAKTGEPGPIWRDVAVSFLQPDTDDRAKLTRYPPAFLAQNTPRFEMEHVGCYVATICVDMKGNSGGATIADFQMSAFETGIDVDGSLDTVRLLSIHGWPFGAAGPQQMKQIADGVTWVRLGRVDDIKIVDSMFLGGIGLALKATAAGAATGSVTNTDFDGEHRAIDMSAGNLSVTGGYFASGGSDDQQIILHDGTLGVNSAIIGCSGNHKIASRPVVWVDGPNASLSITSSPALLCGDEDRTIIEATKGALVFSNNIVHISPNTNFQNPKFLVLKGQARITAIGNRFDDKGRGRGILFDLGSGFNVLASNVAPGWSSRFDGSLLKSNFPQTLDGYFSAK